jgi:lysophospholipase L1-like esterase
MTQSTQSSLRLRRTAALALAMLAILAVFAGGARAANYVALGDSYAAGPIIPNQIAPLGCLKSDHNYAHLAASTIGLPLRDPTCSGATTEDMTNPQETELGTNPPQFNSLDAETTRVSLTIGGNDIGFSSLAQDCFRSTPSNGSPCKDKYTAGGQDEVSRRIQETAPNVAAVLQGIKSRATGSMTYVVNYSAIFPHKGPGCYPQMPVAKGDVPWLRAKQEELNQMLATQATNNGAKLVDVYAASVGHDACALPGRRWVEPVVPASPAAPVHPNLLGMKAMADLVLAAMPA